MTAKTKVLFREFVSLKRQSFRLEKEYYGSELRRKVVLGRFQERKIRHRIRKENLRVGASKRRKYDRLFTQSSLGVPILIPSKRKRRSLVRPGLRTHIPKKTIETQVETEQQ